MTQLPDPIEAMEDSAERWADENIVSEEFRCSCGKWCKLDDAIHIHDNPYAPPVCRDCGLEAMSLQENRTVYACNSEVCGWIGPECDTVHPKHWPDQRLCPRCNETTEPDDFYPGAAP